MTEEIPTQLGIEKDRRLVWTYPSRQSCFTCHNDAAGGVLGLSTAQMNRSTRYPSTGRDGHQLITMNEQIISLVIRRR